MEFTHAIIAACLEDLGEWKAKGKYVQTPEELLANDYSEMNRLLSSFLDALTEAYQAESM